MQVTDHVHAVKIPFPGTSRFVYLYLIYGGKICLIDSGILAGRERLFDYLRDSGRGRDPRETSLIVQTRSHPDHIGLSAEIKGVSNCTVAIHEAEKAWIENIELQVRMRPTLTFRAFVQQSVVVDRTLQDGETLDWEEGLSLKVIHIPGHSRGHVAIFLSRDGGAVHGGRRSFRGFRSTRTFARASGRSANSRTCRGSTPYSPRGTSRSKARGSLL